MQARTVARLYSFGTPTPQPASREQTLSKLAPVLFFQLEKGNRSRTPVAFPLRLSLRDALELPLNQMDTLMDTLLCIQGWHFQDTFLYPSKKAVSIWCIHLKKKGHKKRIHSMYPLKFDVYPRMTFPGHNFVSIIKKVYPYYVSTDFLYVSRDDISRTQLCIHHQKGVSIVCIHWFFMCIQGWHFQDTALYPSSKCRIHGCIFRGPTNVSIHVSRVSMIWIYNFYAWIHIIVLKIKSMDTQHVCEDTSSVTHTHRNIHTQTYN